MTNSAQNLNGFLHRYPWFAVPLWIVGVVVVEVAGLVLLMGAYMGTANGAHPADGPMLSIALYALCATPLVSLVYLVLALMGPRVHRAATVVGVLLLIVVAVAFGAIGTSVSLEPV
ncbi:hypothetical protein [Nocardiopsis dassonvillei]|uniref:hypothetical protein n=1 Tax=Nocardiopsis dassonvillei TaxID=2014 RepID=UPI0012EBF0FC|nr:hypothetical protein [Nocardiopsis dassonvillei]